MNPPEHLMKASLQLPEKVLVLDCFDYAVDSAIFMRHQSKKKKTEKKE